MSSERRLLSHHGPGIYLPLTSDPAVREYVPGEDGGHFFGKQFHYPLHGEKTRLARRPPQDRGHAAARGAPWAACNGWPIPHSPRQLVTEMRDGLRQQNREEALLAIEHTQNNISKVNAAAAKLAADRKEEVRRVAGTDRVTGQPAC